jgi:hypothetical protein
MMNKTLIAFSSCRMPLQFTERDGTRGAESFSGRRNDTGSVL